MANFVLEKYLMDKKAFLALVLAGDHGPRSGAIVRIPHFDLARFNQGFDAPFVPIQ